MALWTRRREREALDAAVERRVAVGAMSGSGYYPTGTNDNWWADLAALSKDTFRASAAVYRCVQTIAANMAALDIEVVDPDGKPNERHHIVELFNRKPNPDWSARVLKELMFSQLELRGETFLYVDRGPTGGPAQALWPIFDRIEVVIDDTGDQDTITGYRVRRGRRDRALLPDEVMWLRYPHPDQRWGCVSPLSSGRFAAELDAYAKAWQAGELRNGGRVDTVVYLGDLPEEEFNKTVAAFQARHMGPANAGRPLFTAGAVPSKVDRLGMTPVEMSYIDTRVKNLEEIALAFGVPIDLLAGRTTYENRRAAKTELWSETLVPKLEVVAGEIDRQLLPDLAETARFDTSQVEALQENQDAIFGRVSRVTYADVLTIDEARALIGKDPLPGGAGAVTLTAYRSKYKQAGGSGTAEARAALTTVEVRAARQVALPRREVLRAYDALESSWVRAVARLADKQETHVLGHIRKVARSAAGTGVEVREAANPADMYDVAYWTSRTVDMLDDAAAITWRTGAADIADALGLSLDLFDGRVLAAMRARLDTLAGQITATTFDVIESRLLEAGVAEGASIDDLAKAVRSVFTDLSTWRAEAIARTETVGGYNAASRTVAAASGVVAAREWLATSDTRTRDSHAELDGHRTAGLDDPYPNGLMHPGDPGGSPEETVNCRCVELYVLAEEDPE